MVFTWCPLGYKTALANKVATTFGAAREPPLPPSARANLCVASTDGLFLREGGPDERIRDREPLLEVSLAVPERTGRRLEWCAVWPSTKPFSMSACLISSPLSGLNLASCPSGSGLPTSCRSPLRAADGGATRLLFHRGRISKQSSRGGGGGWFTTNNPQLMQMLGKMCWHIDKPHLCAERLRSDHCALLSLLFYLQWLPPNICLLFLCSSR